MVAKARITLSCLLCIRFIREYSFIRTNEHLGKHVILLGLAGSYSYGAGRTLLMKIQSNGQCICQDCC